MEWGEAARLVQVLRRDPASQLTAAVEGWDYPLSREGWALADLIDVQGASKAAKGKWKAYPRPIKPVVATVQQVRGNVAGMTHAEVVARLNTLGHNLPTQ